MPFTDSIDKIVTTYFRCVTKTKFHYKGIDYEPAPLTVSPLLLRGFTCPVGCGGCYPRFSLDYLPSEKRPTNTKLRQIQLLYQETLIEVLKHMKTPYCSARKQ